MTEPTLNIIRSFALSLSPEEIAEAERVVAATKTLQNAIGAFHQDVFGAINGWETTGIAGGVVDLKSSEPVPQAGNRKILAELKMRYNTIKASDEKKTWDALDSAAKVFGIRDHVSYIIQVIPKTLEPYDRPWKVSGRESKEHVRAVDGVTGYYYATGEENALKDLLLALPELLEEAFPHNESGSIESVNSTDFVLAAFQSALPAHPAKTKE